MYKNFAEVKSALASGVSVLEITESYLKRIEEKKELNNKSVRGCIEI
jgi:hypothetical protein